MPRQSRPVMVASRVSPIAPNRPRTRRSVCSGVMARWASARTPFPVASRSSTDVLVAPGVIAGPLSSQGRRVLGVRDGAGSGCVVVEHVAFEPGYHHADDRDPQVGVGEIDDDGRLQPRRAQPVENNRNRADWMPFINELVQIQSMESKRSVTRFSSGLVSMSQTVTIPFEVFARNPTMVELLGFDKSQAQGAASPDS